MYIHYKCIDSEFDLNLTLGVNFDPSRRGGGCQKQNMGQTGLTMKYAEFCTKVRAKAPLGCRRGSDPPSLHKNLAKKVVNE